MRKILSGCAIAALLAGCATTPEPESEKRQTRILEVTGGEIVSLETRPSQLVVKATGKASTAGWTHLRLAPTGPGRNGIHEFEFVGDPPLGAVPQVITPVTGTYIVPLRTADFRGARVSAKANSIVIMRRP